MAKTLKKDSTTSISSMPGPKTESKECDSGFIYIPLSHLNSTIHPEEINNNRRGLKLKNEVPSSAKILTKSSYVILYDNRTRNAAWVFEILNKQNLRGEAERSSTFMIDENTHEYYRAPESKKPYSGTGIDRGHLAAANNHRWSHKEVNDTHFLSNISPQHQNLNRGTWKKLENRCQNFIKNNEYQNVYVYTGPLYCPESDEEKDFKVKILGGKAVPTHFFKVIIKEKTTGERELECYKMPNRKLNRKLMQYRTYLEVIEKLSGLVFRDTGFADDHKVKSKKNGLLTCFNFFSLLGKGQCKECDPGFIYIPFSHLNPTVHTGKIINKTRGFKLKDRAPSFDKPLNKSSHLILYDNRTRNAAWVFEILNDQTITGEAERPLTFMIDEDIHEYYRAPESQKTYRKTDFEKGHLAAADNHRWSQKAMNDTHLLSNIVPRHQNLNTGTWTELEDHCQNFIKNNEYQNVYVYTGPLYCPESDDETEFKVKIIKGKAVPTHFFKVIIKEKTKGERELECYKMPNRELPVNEELTKYKTDLKVIEKLSGLVFSENSQETRSKRVTVHMKAEQENKEITTEVQIIIPESESARIS